MQKLFSNFRIKKLACCIACYEIVIKNKNNFINTKILNGVTAVQNVMFKMSGMQLLKCILKKKKNLSLCSLRYLF